MTKTTVDRKLRRDLDNLPAHVLTNDIDKYSNEANPIVRNDDYCTLIDNVSLDKYYTQWIHDTVNNTVSKTFDGEDSFVLQLATIPALEYKDITGVSLSFKCTGNGTLNYVGIGSANLIKYLHPTGFATVTVGGASETWGWTIDELYDMVYTNGLRLGFGFSSENNTITVSDLQINIHFNNGLQGEADVIENRLEIINLKPLIDKNNAKQVIYKLGIIGTVATGQNAEYSADKTSNYQSNEYVPPNWSNVMLEVSKNNPALYMSYRTYSDNVWSTYSDAVLVSTYNDGKQPVKYEYIYKTSTGEADIPTIPTEVPSEGMPPNGWVISQPSLSSSNNSCWMCIRKTNDNGIWQPYYGTSENKPILVANYGKDSINVMIGNESQAINCDENGITTSAQVITIPFWATKGSLGTSSSITIKSGLVTGITQGTITNATSSNNYTGSITLNVANTSDLGSSDSGNIILTITTSTSSFDKTFSWNKIKKGATGDTGQSGTELNGNDIINKLVDTANTTGGTLPSAVIQTNTFADYFADYYAAHDQFIFYKIGNGIFVKIGVNDTENAPTGVSDTEGLWFYVYTPTNTGDWVNTQIAQLPENLRPNHTVYIGNNIRDGNNYSGVVKITTDGYIYKQGGVKTNSTFQRYAFSGTGFYFLEGNTVTTLTVPSTTVKFGDSLSATLTAGTTALTDKKIGFRLNGRGYMATTNSNGTATRKIQLTPATYSNSTVSYNGDATYKSSKQTFNLIVQATTPILYETDYNGVLIDNILTKSTIESPSNSDLNFRLTNENGVTLTNVTIEITINGKTYNIVTNDSPVMHFPINLTKKTYPIRFKCSNAGCSFDKTLNLVVQ